VLVADRWMVTRANLQAIRDREGIEWFTALKAPQVKRLARTGAFQPSLFDEQNLAEGRRSRQSDSMRQRSAARCGSRATMLRSVGWPGRVGL
jgi:hypothetical protein